MYVIHNRPPTTWTGRRINIGIYKEDKLLLLHKNLCVGEYCELRPTKKLYMCCMTEESPDGHVVSLLGKKDSIGTIDVAFTPLVQVDLTHYPNGVDIELTEVEVSGQVKFTPKAHIH